MARVSVVVPTYNSVAFIDATMRSILTQTFDELAAALGSASGATNA